MATELTVQELLFNEQPIVINRKLAKCLGLKEAVVFQQIHYWLELNKRTKNNFKENKYWTYNSIKAWHENEFDFLSLRTVERTLQKLEKDGLLESKTFNKMAGDKTKWYTINYDKLLEVCNKSLSEKEILSIKRKEAGRKGAEVKATKKELSNTIQPIWQNGDPYNQLGRTIQPTWQNDTTNLAEAIPETSTETSTETSISSSSKGNTPDSIYSLIDLFDNSICKLKKTTTVKFMNYIEKYDQDFIKAIITYCEERNAKSFSYFQKTIDRYISEDITTVDALNSSIENFKDENKTKKNNALKAKDEARKEKEFEDTINENILEDMINDKNTAEEAHNKINAGENVNELKELLKKDITDVQFNTWIAGLDFKLNANELFIVCPNAFTKDILIKRYEYIIKNAVKQAELNVEIEYVVAE